MKPNTTLPTNLSKTWALLVTAAALFAGSSYAAPPTPISSCGTVISAAGNYFLAQNLTCPGASGVIIAASKVDLDLKGFTIDGGGGSGFGISTSSGQMSSTADLSLCLAVTNIHIHSGTIKGYGRIDGSLGRALSYAPRIHQAKTTNNYTSHNLVGIEAQEFAAGNVFNGNTSFANTSLDLEDDNANCTNNTWRGNFFGTSFPGCTQ
jgi:hypothetical protein